MRIKRKDLNRLIENFLLESDDSYDRAKAQHDIDYGDKRNRKIGFGPSPEGRDKPITDDEITYADLDADDQYPTPSQVKHGQDYYRFYKDVDQDFDSVHSDKTQSNYRYDDDEDTIPQGLYGKLGKTEPRIDFDDETVTDPGDTVYAINPEDDFDLSLDDIEPENYGTYEDDEDTDDEDDQGLLAKIRKFLKD